MPRRCVAPSTASRSCTTSPRPTEKRGSPIPRIAPSTSKAPATSSKPPGRPGSGASCTAAPAACTGTSRIRRRTKTRRSIPATSIRTPSSPPSNWRASSAPPIGLDVVVARPIGIYGPGDKRFLTMFRGLARGRFPMIGSGQAFYHLTFIDDLVEGFRLCGTVPAAAGRTYILAGPRYTTLEQLVQTGREGTEGRAAARAPAGVAVLDGGPAVRTGLRAAAHRAADLSPPRRLLHQEPRVRHHTRAHRAGLRTDRSISKRASSGRRTGIGVRDCCERPAPGSRLPAPA